MVDDLRRNTLDMYSTVRSAYSQRRAAQIRNGAAPIDDQSYDDIFKDPEGGGDDAHSVPGPALGRRHLLLAAGAIAALPVARAGAADASAETFIERLGQETIEILKQTRCRPRSGRRS